MLLLPRLLDPSCEFLHPVVHRPVLADDTRDLRGRVDDRGVVAAAELLANLRQRGVCELAREIHRDLPGIDDVLGTAVTCQLAERHREALADELLDPLDRDGGSLTLREDVP